MFGCGNFASNALTLQCLPAIVPKVQTQGVHRSIPCLANVLRVSASAYHRQPLCPLRPRPLQRVWDVSNYVSTAAILAKRTLAAANALLAVYFFRVWLDILTLGEGSRCPSRRHNDEGSYLRSELYT